MPISKKYPTTCERRMVRGKQNHYGMRGNIPMSKNGKKREMETLNDKIAAEDLRKVKELNGFLEEKKAEAQAIMCAKEALAQISEKLVYKHGLDNQKDLVNWTTGEIMRGAKVKPVEPIKNEVKAEAEKAEEPKEEVPAATE